MTLGGFFFFFITKIHYFPPLLSLAARFPPSPTSLSVFPALGAPCLEPLLPFLSVVVAVQQQRWSSSSSGRNVAAPPNFMSRAVGL